MYNYVRIIEYETVVLIRLKACRLLRIVFAAFVFVFIFLPWHEEMAR